MSLMDIATDPASDAIVCNMSNERPKAKCCYEVVINVGEVVSV
jgi:hypothetical protein